MEGKKQMKDGTARKRRARVLDALCVAGVVLIPFSLGAFFVMLVRHDAAPLWYLVIHGLLTAAAFVALGRFIAIGLFRAILNKRPPEEKGGDGR